MSSAKIIELNEENTCKLCDNALAKYVCPKCSINYCSLICYQSAKHQSCSEEFYKDCVFEDLNVSDDPSQAKMMEILKKVHESNQILDNDLDDEDSPLDSDDNEDVDDITERLKGIDLDNAELVWDKLTEDERQEFVAFLHSEDVTKLIPPWTPWWDYFDEKKVQEVENQEFKNNCPKIVPIVEFSKICQKPPAFCIQYDLINILGGYVFMARYFNGEYEDFTKEAVACISEISLSLKSCQNFADQDFACKSLEHQICLSDWIQMDTENLKNMEDDLQKILRGPSVFEPKFYILCALSDLLGLLNKSMEVKEEDNFSKTFAREQFPSVKLVPQKTVKAYVKRIEFFLSYAKHIFEG